MEEKKRKSRQMPCLEVKVPTTGISFAEILQQTPTLEDKAEVDFK